MRKVIAIALVLLVGVLLWRFVWHQAPLPENTAIEAKVSGQVMASPRFPSVKLEFAPEFKYAGGQRFQQREAADAEQHFWIEADDHQTIRRMFWIQHQGYLPNNNYSYDEDDGDPQTEYAGLRWLTATGVQTPPRDEPEPDADFSRMLAYLRSKGYTWPNSWLRYRLITTDEKARNQFMIWFMEDSDLIVTKEPDMGKLESGDKEEHAKMRYLHIDPANPKRWLDERIEPRMQQRIKISR
jgi:hypothetical protein